VIDPLVEDLIWPTEATNYYPRGAAGKKVHVCKVYRDMSKGHRGIVLESIRTPRLATSRQALVRFFARLSGASRMSVRPHADQLVRKNQVAEAELDRLGF
jgi:hypothetical protein